MRRPAQAAFVPLIVVLVWLSAMSARAQVAISSTPIQAKPLHTRAVKPVKAKFEVMHMLPTFIQVRSIANATEVHAFTYSDDLRPRMEQMLSRGPYQYGDKVTIVYWPDKQVAVKISGKHSKP